MKYLKLLLLIVMLILVSCINERSEHPIAKRSVQDLIIEFGKNDVMYFGDFLYHDADENYGTKTFWSKYDKLHLSAVKEPYHLYFNNKTKKVLWMITEEGPTISKEFSTIDSVLKDIERQ